MIDSGLIYCQNLVRQIKKKENENGLNNFLNACKRILDIHAPC